MRRSLHKLALTAWLGLVSTAFAYVLFVRGLRAIPASTAGTLGLAEPLVAVAVAVVVLGERLDALEIAGGVLLLAGVVLASVPPLRRAPDAVRARTAPLPPAAAPSPHGDS